MTGRLAISILFCALAVTGCVSTYGGFTGDFGMLSIKSTAAAKEYRIVRYADYATAFPGSPAAVETADQRLVAFFEGRPVHRSNQTIFPYRSGRYFVTYACGDRQIFKLFTLSKAKRATEVRISCQ